MKINIFTNNVLDLHNNSEKKESKQKKNIPILRGSVNDLYS